MTGFEAAGGTSRLPSADRLAARRVRLAACVVALESHAFHDQTEIARTRQGTSPGQCPAVLTAHD